jgi:hypothetical protein
MLKNAFHIFLLCLFLSGNLYPQSTCDISELAFKSGESLDYEVYYHWGLIWANAGSANFSIKHDQFQNKKVFHIVSEGITYKGYDWFYKVRDKFESWVDTASLKPLRYIRNSNEGSNHTYNDNYFNFSQKQAVCFKIIKNKMRKDTVKITDCTLDVMTMIYYARCINYSKCKPNDKIPISLYLDGEVNDTLHIRYLGTGKIKTALGEKNCIIFSPLLIKGTIFSGGEGMKVWVTDDEKKTPLLIKTPIVVGEIQVKIKWIKN